MGKDRVGLRDEEEVGVFIDGNGAIVDLNEGLGIWVYAEEQ